MPVDLDVTDVALLRELQGDARLSFRQLAGRVGLSPPATAERVRRLESSGILQGYRAVVSPAAIGRGLEAFIRIRPNNNTAAETLTTLLADTGAVRELHHLVGEDCFLLRIAVADIPQLEALLSRVTPHGTSTTSIILSSPVTFMAILPPPGRA
jgi:Lrp/AsnC family leucine-responsive transcriptional regulator